MLGMHAVSVRAQAYVSFRAPAKGKQRSSCQMMQRRCGRRARLLGAGVRARADEVVARLKRVAADVLAERVGRLG